MEFLFFGAFAYALYWGIGRAFDMTCRSFASVHRRQTEAWASSQRESEAVAARRRRSAKRQYRRQQRQRRLNALARNFQVALLQLDRATDFRRVANLARHAKDVPLGFRQRQFRRFRPRLVQHMTARLQVGVDPELLCDSLAELLTALGVSEFEADYIREEAERRQPPTPQVPEPTFTDELQRQQQQHNERMSAIRGLTIEAEIKEQMLEAERTRFERQMVRGEDHAGHDAADFTI